MSTFVLQIQNEEGIFVPVRYTGVFKNEEAANYAVEILMQLVPGVYRVVVPRRGRPIGAKNKNPLARKKYTRKSNVDSSNNVVTHNVVVDAVGEIVEELSETQVHELMTAIDAEMDKVPPSRAA